MSSTKSFFNPIMRYNGMGCYPGVYVKAVVCFSHLSTKQTFYLLDDPTKNCVAQR